MRDLAATADSNLEAIRTEPVRTEPAADQRLFTPAFIALSLAELAYFTTAGLLIPITTLFAAGPLGANALGIGIVVGSFAVTTVVLRPIAGREADRRGRRPLLIGGALLCAIAVALHAVTTDLTMLIGLRLLLGVAEAFFFVAGFAMVADLAPPNRAGEAISFNSLSLYLGIAIGPTIGFALLSIGGFGLAFAGGAVLSLAATALAVRIPETVAPAQRNQPPTPLFNRGAVGPSVALFCGIAGMAGFLAFVAIYAPRVGMVDAGPVLLLFGLVVVGCRVVFARLPDRVPPFRLAAAALAVTAVGLLVAGLLPSVAGLLVGATLLAVGVAFTTPAIFTAIVARVSPSERGSAFGTTSLFLDLAFGGGPVVLGLVAQSAGVSGAFIVAAIVALLGAAGTAAAARTASV
jgi:predicted MFS family arabinose efflux permease